MIWKRTFLVGLLAITGIALQTSVFGEATFNGTKPDLMLLITVALALTEGPMVGAIGGFTLGLCVDLLAGLPAGISALTFTLAGAIVGSIRAQMQEPTAWLPIAMVSVTTFLGVLFYGGFSLVLGEESLPALRILRHAGQSAAYNALLTPFVYPVIRFLGRALRPNAAGVTVR